MTSDLERAQPPQWARHVAAKLCPSWHCGGEYQRHWLDVAAAIDTAWRDGAEAMRERAAEKVHDFANIADPCYQTQQDFNLIIKAVRALPTDTDASGESER